MTAMLATIRSVGVAQLWAIIIGAVGGGLVMSAILIFVLNTPPTILLDMHEADGVAMRGQSLDLIVTRNQEQNCLTTVSRWLWRTDPTDPNGQRMEWRPLDAAPFNPPIGLGLKTYRLSIPLPADIEPGPWHYLGIAFDSCNGFWGKQLRRSKDFVVEIQ
jgi:hypothetical protein